MTIRNKEVTKQRLLDAVGEIIRESGYKDLGVNNIAKVAGVDKKLIYRYFNSADELIESYILSKDYWLGLQTKLQGLKIEHNEEHLKTLAKTLFKEQYKDFFSNKEMQSLILWEISEKNNLMKEISDRREGVGQPLLALFDSYFDKDKVNIRAVSAIIVAGIYYLVLHNKTAPTTFSEIDLSTEEGKKEIEKGIDQIIEGIFKLQLEK